MEVSVCDGRRIIDDTAATGERISLPRQLELRDVGGVDRGLIPIIAITPASKPYIGQVALRAIADWSERPAAESLAVIVRAPSVAPLGMLN
jgi:hypothetical protein